MGIFSIYKIKSNSYLYLAFCLVRRGSIWKIWSQPGVTGCYESLPILATPCPKVRKRWQKQKKNKKLSHLLEGRECHLMLEILKQQEMLLNNHSKKQVRIIFKPLGLGTTFSVAVPTDRRWTVLLQMPCVFMRPALCPFPGPLTKE